MMFELVPRSRLIRYRELPNKNHRWLYILAGPSGSGKSTLLRAAAEKKSPIFGKDYQEASYLDALYRICRCETRLKGIQPIEVTCGAIISFSELRVMSAWGLAPALITFLHVDLSFLIKKGFQDHQEPFWLDAVGIANPRSPDCFNPEAVCRFWDYMFCEDIVAKSDFSLACFSHIAINTVYSKRRDVIAAKKRRDLEKKYIRDDERWLHVMRGLYSDTDSSRQLYKNHVAGWELWVAKQAAVRRLKVLATHSLHEENAFLVRGDGHAFKLLAN